MKSKAKNDYFIIEFDIRGHAQIKMKSEYNPEFKVEQENKYGQFGLMPKYSSICFLKIIWCH